MANKKRVRVVNQTTGEVETFNSFVEVIKSKGWSINLKVRFCNKKKHSNYSLHRGCEYRGYSMKYVK